MHHRWSGLRHKHDVAEGRQVEHAPGPWSCQILGRDAKGVQECVLLVSKRKFKEKSFGNVRFEKVDSNRLKSIEPPCLFLVTMNGCFSLDSRCLAGSAFSSTRVPGRPQRLWNSEFPSLPHVKPENQLWKVAVIKACRISEFSCKMFYGILRFLRSETVSFQTKPSESVFQDLLADFVGMSEDVFHFF